jgi:hypothetical protein
VCAAWLVWNILYVARECEALGKTGAVRFELSMLVKLLARFSRVSPAEVTVQFKEHGSAISYLSFTARVCLNFSFVLWNNTLDYKLDDRGSIPGRGKIFFSLSSLSRPALGRTQPPIQWVPGVKRGQGVTLTTHHYLVSRSRMSRSYIFCPSCRPYGGSGTA